MKTQTSPMQKIADANPRTKEGLQAYIEVYGEDPIKLFSRLYSYFEDYFKNTKYERKDRNHVIYRYFQTVNGHLPTPVSEKNLAAISSNFIDTLNERKRQDVHYEARRKQHVKKEKIQSQSSSRKALKKNMSLLDWYEYNEEIIQDLNNPANMLSKTALAKKYDVSVRHLNRIIDQGYENPVPRKKYEKLKKLEQLVEKGYSVNDVAKMIGSNAKFVYYHVNRYRQDCVVSMVQADNFKVQQNALILNQSKTPYLDMSPVRRYEYNELVLADIRKGMTREKLRQKYQKCSASHLDRMISKRTNNTDRKRYEKWKVVEQMALEKDATVEGIASEIGMNKRFIANYFKNYAPNILHRLVENKSKVLPEKLWKRYNAMSIVERYELNEIILDDIRDGVGREEILAKFPMISDRHYYRLHSKMKNIVSKGRYDEWIYVEDMFKKGCSVMDICKMVNMNQRTVYNYVRTHGGRVNMDTDM